MNFNTVFGTQVSNIHNQGDSSFCNRFFNLSRGIEQYRNDTSIVKRLEALEKGGYCIDEQKVIFGENQFGTCWPCLELPGVLRVYNGMSVGSQNSLGYGSTKFLEYLEQKENDLKNQHTTQASQTQFLFNAWSQPTPTYGNQRQPINHQRPYSSASVTTSSNNSNLQSLFKIFNTPGSNTPGSMMIGGSFNSLPDLRKAGIFHGEPSKKANYLTADELKKCELAIYADNLCMIMKGNQILACSEGLVILPKASEILGTIMYDHGNGSQSDIPCKNKLIMKSRIGEGAITEALEYFQSIPAFSR